MSKLLQASAMLALCFMLSLGLARAEDFGLDADKELAVLPWPAEIAKLAASCTDLTGAECAVARNLVEEPRAYWMGWEVSLSEEILVLHAILRNALSTGHVPTIVLSRFPFQYCEDTVSAVKAVTIKNYKRWVVRIASVLHHYKAPVRFIVEPGALAALITNPDQQCNGRDKSELLEELRELIRYIIANFDDRGEKGESLNPWLRIFIDAGSPSQITAPKDRVAMAKTLEQMYALAKFHGISVNVAKHDSFDDSVRYAKQILMMIRHDDLRKKIARLTIAYDKSRSGNPIKGSCNARGAALDAQASTLDHPDPQVELVTIIKTPGLSDGDGPSCSGGGLPGDFDPLTFVDYLHNTAARHPPKQN